MVTLLKSDIENFAEYIKLNNKKIICFAAGANLNGWIAYYFDYYNLNNHVEYIVDNNKYGNKIILNEKEYKIVSVSEMLNNIQSDSVILLTSSYFYNMLKQLDDIRECDGIPCFIAPIMFLEKQKDDINIIEDNNEKEVQQIPKLIHYMWLGGGEMSDLHLKCIESWKKFCPDYEIVRWDEKNYDFSKYRYMQEAYKEKKWGYVPDLARLDIIYEYGGIYLDTDVELIRSLDEVLINEAFCGFEACPLINIGGGFGGRREYFLFKKMIDLRKDMNFVFDDGSYNLAPNTYFETPFFRANGVNLNGTLQLIDGMKLYPAEYFHPKNIMTGTVSVTEKTFGIHHFGWSWADSNQQKERNLTNQEYLRVLNRMKKI